MIDDTLSNPGTGIAASDGITYCGSACTRHSFTITSAIDQEVYIMFSSWDRRMYPARTGCGTKTFTTPAPADFKYGIKWNIAGQSGAKGVNGEVRLANYGTPFMMGPGVTGTIDAELFGATGVMKDYAVVAFGSAGPV
jgi:hypothetical protein